jgi:hypothetical protein
MPAPGNESLSTVGISDPTQFTDLTLYNSNLVNLRRCRTSSEVSADLVNNSSLKPGTPDIILHKTAAR